MLIETHFAVLGEINGAAGRVYLLGSMSASFRSEQQACPLGYRVRSNSMLHPQRRIGERTEENEPPPNVPTSCRAARRASPFARSSWPKRELTAANNSRRSCYASPRSQVVGLYTPAIARPSGFGPPITGTASAERRHCEILVTSASNVMIMIDLDLCSRMRNARQLHIRNVGFAFTTPPRCFLAWLISRCAMRSARFLWRQGHMWSSVNM